MSYNLGLLLGETGNYQEAAELLGRAADNVPGLTRARYNQALALLKLQRWEEGIKAIEQAVLAEPANQDYFAILVDLYMRSGALEKVRELTESILKLVPRHAAARQIKAQLSGQ